MSSDFAKMLKTTLAKMQDRIDFGITQFDGEGEGSAVGKPPL